MVHSVELYPVEVPSPNPTPLSPTPKYLGISQPGVGNSRTGTYKEIQGQVSVILIYNAAFGPKYNPMLVGVNWSTQK